MTAQDKLQAIRALCNRKIKWEKINTIEIKGEINKPQGLVKIKDKFYLTSAKFKDQNSGEAILSIIDENGNLLKSHVIGTGLVFHPGGLDVENGALWIPVAEFRPDSSAVVLKVSILDQDEIKVDRILKFSDHLSLLFSNDKHDTIYGYNWGATILYKIHAKNTPPTVEKFDDVNNYIDYQDCKKIDDNFVFCLGRKEYDVPEAGKVSIAGLDLLNYQTNTLECTIPVELWLEKPYIAMAKNPFWFDIVDDKLLLYFIPEFYHGNIHIYHPEFQLSPYRQNAMVVGECALDFDEEAPCS